MSSNRSSLVTQRYIILARSFVVTVGCVAVCWGIVEFPFLSQESSIERVASQIVAGAPFRAEILARQLPVISSIEAATTNCSPVALRSAAIIRLRIVEAATSINDHEHVEEHLKSLGNLIRSSLSCSPADPFLWLVLFRIEDDSNRNLKFLRMSYQLGPKEGWIAVKRNPVTLANIGILPPDLTEAGISEFVALVDSHFYTEASEILAGLAQPIRSLLHTRLKDLKEADREAFSKVLFDRRLDDIPVPGATPPVQRPWH